MILSRTKRLSLIAGIALLLAGCTKTDADVLAGIGRKLVDRGQKVSDNLEQAWTKMPGRQSLDSRVRARLRWEKSLAESPIEVHAVENTVELKGTVAGEEQARRAVELAEATLGVDRVVNSLQIEHRP
jgi:hypothetical protein